MRELIADVTANLPMPRAAIVGEPTLMKIINGHKGGRSLRTAVHGVAGHSSEPHRGANAIMAAAHIIVELQKIQAELQASADPDNGFDPPFDHRNRHHPGRHRPQHHPWHLLVRLGVPLSPGLRRRRGGQRVRDFVPARSIRG